jgi:hypothetical protein
MVEAGEKCRCHLDGLRTLPATGVQVDELWAYCRIKEKARLRLDRGPSAAHV